MKFVDGYSFKCLNWLVGVLGIERVWIVAYMQSKTAEQTEIVDVRSAMVIFLQRYYGHVTFDVVWQHYSDASYGVLQDAIDENCRIRFKFDNPFRVGSLTQCPLKDIRFLYSFQENLESVGVRDQARFVEVSSTAVTRAMVKSLSTRCPISKNEAITNIKFKNRGLIWENMTKFQPSDVRSSV